MCAYNIKTFVRCIKRAELIITIPKQCLGTVKLNPLFNVSYMECATVNYHYVILNLYAWRLYPNNISERSIIN